ncbi:hypothetical protein Tco_0241331 [Tanacetum coccineum]
MFFSTSPTPCGGSDLLLGETYTILSHFNDSSPDYETFCFDIGEKSSGSTTSHSDHSFLEYESFCFDVDHIKKKSSGSTTSHSDLSILEYESFHFDLLIDPLPPADRSDSHLEEFVDELAHIIFPPEYDHFYFDLKDISSLDPPESTLVIDESTQLVTPLPDSKEISLREVEIFDPFISLTQSGEKTRVMETSSFGFHHMPLPRPAAYSPKEVMYCYYHIHLTSGDGFDPKIKIPSGESKVHIKVLSVLWGNSQNKTTASCRLGRPMLQSFKGWRTPDVAAFKKTEEISKVEIRLLALVG